MTMETITFYSYKGGTGRSLALANAARYLARLEFNVVVLDFDLEAPGMHYKFSMNSQAGPLPVDQGLVDYLHEMSLGYSAPSSLEKFIINVPVPGTDKQSLKLIPAGRVPSADYWRKLSQLNWHDLFYSPGSNGVQMFLDLKARIASELAPDFLLIDSRTGITELGGVATTLLPDRIICMVLPNAENLEGARAVLRSFNRSARDIGQNRIQLTVALSRLPQMREDESERELTESIRLMLNEDAESLEDTLTCEEIFILHSESSLQITETLRVGSGVSPDQSILLRDYLRLFAEIVPRELIEPKFGRLIGDAKERLWSDPNAAVKEIEELAESFGHPDTYRALLMFYEVRNIRGATALRRAQRLWELTRNPSEEVLWHIVQPNFEATPRPRSEWTPSLEFIEAVWRANAPEDIAFGEKIADAYNFADKAPRAADIWLEMFQTSGGNPEMAARCIDQLTRAGRMKEADAFVESLRVSFGGNPAFVEAWARHALSRKDGKFTRELADDPVFPVLAAVSPSVAARIALKAGRREAATKLMENAYRAALRSGEVEELTEVGIVFDDLGEMESFEKRIRGDAPEALVDRILMNLRRQRRVFTYR